MSKRGRKSKYETHVKPRFKDIVKWCKRGATDEEIIKALGIGKTAFYEYKQKYAELTELIEKNRVDAVEEIKSALFKKAIGFQYVEIKEINGINSHGLTFSKTEKTTKTALPDVAAGLVLLKHWAKDEEWTNDPQSLKLRREEFEHKKKIEDENSW